MTRRVRAVALPGGTMSLRQLSEISGVGPHVLELWRQRYDFPARKMPGAPGAESNGAAESDGAGLVGVGRPGAPHQAVADCATEYGPGDVMTVLHIAHLARRRYEGDAIAAGAQLLGKRAAQHVARTQASPARPRLPLSVVRARFVRALADLDGQRASSLLLTGFGHHPEEAVIRRVLAPAGRTMAGEMLTRQPERIGAYLFANVSRQVLNRQADRYRQPAGPMLWLACPRGEIHDVGLHGVRLVLAARGWATLVLGQNTDLGTLRAAAGRHAPAAVLLTASRSVVLHRQISALRALAETVPTFLGGIGVTRAAADATGATALVAPLDQIPDLLRVHLAAAGHDVPPGAPAPSSPLIANP